MRRSGFFIRAREEEKRWTERERETERERPAALNGDEARDFYRSLFEDEDGVRREERREERREKRREERREERREKRRERRRARAGRSRGKGGGAGEGGVKNSGGGAGEGEVKNSGGGAGEGGVNSGGGAGEGGVKNSGGGAGEGGVNSGGGAGEGGVNSGGVVGNSGAAPPAGRTDGYRLLRCAEQGDIRGLEDVLRRGCNVNFRDQFNWTALMSAACSGRTDTVRVLLQRGALWTSITDTQGRDARDLARLAGHHDVVTVLEQFSITQSSHTSHTPTDPTHSSPPPQRCEVCEVCYTDSAHTHTSSTLHQFSLKRPPSLPHYCLAPSSVGYKVMLRLGWDPHSGLGPEHSGRLDPVGTVLKSERTGLGFGPKPRSKVTHFKANDVQAVRRAPERREERQERGTTVSAKNRKRTEERQRQWERDYRTSFNIDS